jgi:sulfur relay (sulfurtransferase) DsrF/TusC family protein
MADIFTILQRQVSTSEIALSGRRCARRAYILIPPGSSAYTVFLLKDPAVDAKEAQQPEGLLCNPVVKMMKMIRFFCFFHFKGAPME